LGSLRGRPEPRIIQSLLEHNTVTKIKQKEDVWRTLSRLKWDGPTSAGIPGGNDTRKLCPLVKVQNERKDAVVDRN